jgi:hypothetical protein
MSWSDSLYGYVVGKLADWADKKRALDDLNTLTWVNRYSDYYTAALYVDSILAKYPEDLDVRKYTGNAKVYAKYYFHIY